MQPCTGRSDLPARVCAPTSSAGQGQAAAEHQPEVQAAPSWPISEGGAQPSGSGLITPRIQVCRGSSWVLAEPPDTAGCCHPAADGCSGWLGWTDGCVRTCVRASHMQGFFPLLFSSSWPSPLCWQLIRPDRVGVELQQPRSR